MAGEARTATASVLFVDVVGSTETRARLGEEAADTVRRDTELRLNEIVERHRGRVLKGLGDGVLAVFDAAADAVGAGVAMQQQAPPDVRFRVGISTGDVSFEAGDVFGAPVVEASRLCGTAQEGQILVADLVRSLARGRGGHVFEPVGELELKGLPEPVPACQVSWTFMPATAGSLPLPGLLTMGPRRAYVGRSDVLARLAEMWQGLSRGGCAAALLAGEPGVGKTRTASEIAELAHADGAVVLYGSCDEALSVPFQPFVEALDFHTTHELGANLGRLPGELSRLLPELAQRIPGLPSAVVSDPATEEYRLFESVASWLSESSRGRGLVLILDDLHWATRGTLLMLLHTLKHARVVTDARLLLVGTYRDTEVDRVHPLSAVLADLRRLPVVKRVPLTGLTRDEVVTFAEAAAGHELDADGYRLADAVFAETAGNPFFITEVFRHLVETGQIRLAEGRWAVAEPDHVEVPEGVRDVIGRRVGRLSDNANRALAVAAVLGREFDLELLGWVTDLDEAVLLDAVDEACRARLAEEIGRDRFRFAHAVVRETLYDELSSTRRRRLHRQATEVLAKIRPHDATALAYHAVEAGPVGGDVTAALAYLMAAAEQAVAARALADAAVCYRKVLELVDEHGAPEEQIRVEAMCGLGEAQRDQGDAEFRSTLLQAGWAALSAGLVELAARAAIANQRGFASVISGVDEERVELLNAVLEALGAEQSARTAMVLATLGEELLYDSSQRERRLDLADRAVAMAAELGDPRTEAAVAIRCFDVGNVPERWAEQPARLAALTEIADFTGDPILRSLARHWAAYASVGVGDLTHARRTYEEAAAIAETDGRPSFALLGQWMLVQFLAYDGDVAGAERAAALLHERARRVGWEDADQWYGAARQAIGWAQGRTHEAADLIGALADANPGYPGWRFGQAEALCRAGRLDEARAIVERYGLNRAGAVPWDHFSPLAWTSAACAAFFLADAEFGALAEESLRPYADFWAHCGMWITGPTTWTLALAVAAQGRWREAAVLFEAAEAVLESHGLVGHRLQVTGDLIHALLARGDGKAAVRARDLAQAARAEAAERGLMVLVARFDALLAQTSSG